MIDIATSLSRTVRAVATICILLPLSAGAQEPQWEAVRLGDDSQWPAWRGPLSNGISPAPQIPTQWSNTENLRWTRPLDSWGDSTPAISDGNVFLTSQNDAGELKLWKLSAQTGEVLREIVLDQAALPRQAPKRKTQKFHNLHNMASPSPVIADGHVVVHFGNGLLSVFTVEGEEVWRRNLQEEYGLYSIWWGHANSPVVHEGMVISVCMQDSLDDLQDKPVESYLVAHDLKTGEVKWKTLRMTGAPGEEADAYTTPLLIERAGKTQMLVMGANQLDAYNPATGKQLWYLPGLVGGRTVTGPVLGDGTIFTTRGMRGSLLAIELGDYLGEVSEDSIRWTADKTTPDTPCPLFWEGLLFTVTDDGIATCYDAATGEVHWKERLGGGFKASPIAVAGNVYFLNVDGQCTIVAAKREFEKVAENKLDDTTIASPAVANGNLFIRGKKGLYCIGK